MRCIGVLVKEAFRASNQFDRLFHAFSCSVSASFFAMDKRCTLSDGKIIIIVW